MKARRPALGERRARHSKAKRSEQKADASHGWRERRTAACEALSSDTSRIGKLRKKRAEDANDPTEPNPKHKRPHLHLNDRAPRFRVERRENDIEIFPEA